MDNVIRFVNLTPHAITVRTAEGDKTFPPSGKVARVGTVETPAGEVMGIPIVTRTLGKVEGLDLLPGTVGIVSSMVLDAAKTEGHPLLSRLLAPDSGATAIREKGQVVAVVRFVGA